MNPCQLFLCAVGRSGTTILRTSLGKHPGIYYNDRENNIVQDLIGVAQSNCWQESRKFAMVVEQSEYDQIFHTAIRDLIWPDHQLRCRPLHMAAINPTGDQLDYLTQVFPKSKIVCLVRNGIEVVSSRMRYKSFANNSFESHCKTWTRSQSVFEWGQANTSSFRLIRHEWFYRPEKLQSELDTLYQWLGIQLSEMPANNILQRLRHPTDQQNVDFANMSESDKAVYFQSKAERWRDWSEAQRSAFANICSPFMHQLGYELPWLNH